MILTYLQTFVHVAKSGSFTKTAEEMGYAQSSITTQIQKLEETYGVVLFERYGRKMKLTQPGEALLPYAHDILQLYVESKQVIADQVTGTITIGSAESLATYFLPPYLHSFRHTHPAMNVSLQVGSESSIVQAVKDGSYDLCFLMDTSFNDPELQSLQLEKIDLVIVAKSGHRLQNKQKITIHDLKGETLIMTEEGCTYRSMLVKALKEHHINYQLAYQFGNVESIKKCVLFGLGIALLPKIVVQNEVEKGELIAIPLSHPGNPFYVQLIFHQKKWISKGVRDFIELIRSNSTETIKNS